MNQTPLQDQVKPTAESGFTLIETVISMVLLTIIAMGVASLFAYSITATSNASDRQMATAVGQQAMEQLRSVPFNDISLLATSTNGTTVNVRRLGRTYSVNTVIIDTSVVGSTVTQKAITIKVIPMGSTASWARNVSTLFSSVTLITTRSSLSMGPNRSI